MKILKLLAFCVALTSFCNANAGVMGMLNTAPQNVKMTAYLDAKSQLMIKLEVNNVIENCPISLGNADLGYTTPKNMNYKEIKGVNFFAFYQGHKCWERVEKSGDYLPSLAAEINFFEKANVPTEKGIEILKASGIKLSFCFQVSDPYVCSKPIGFEDLKSGPVKIFPLSSIKK